VESIPVSGKIDGLVADPEKGRLLATVNEDLNSAFNVVDPLTAKVATYQYSPSPAVSGNGGTDSIVVDHGHIFVAHSNPADTTQATEYEVTLDSRSSTATLRPVFFDNGPAIDAASGQPVQMALTDPDTNYLMPAASPRFRRQLATISQADGKIIFASHLRDHPQLTQLTLSDNVDGNVPPIDGLAVATTEGGSLYVVDSGTGKVSVLDTSGWPAGTVFVTEPSDNGNPLLGTVDFYTGRITPLANTFTSPKGLLFVARSPHPPSA
jgi:hypothetical protein